MLFIHQHSHRPLQLYRKLIMCNDTKQLGTRNLSHRPRNDRTSSGNRKQGIFWLEAGVSSWERYGANGWRYFSLDEGIIGC